MLIQEKEHHLNTKLYHDTNRFMLKSAPRVRSLGGIVLLTRSPLSLYVMGNRSPTHSPENNYFCSEFRCLPPRRSWSLFLLGVRFGKRNVTLLLVPGR